MMVGFLIGLAFLFVPPSAHARSPIPTGVGRVEEVRYASDALGTRARYHVYLPPGYEASARRYPVIVALHGLGGESGDWFSPEHADLRGQLDAAIASGVIGPVIAVAPDGLAGYWTDHVSGARGTAWGTFIGEVIDHASARYRASERRAIVGVSMGGHGAMSHGLMHPERFVAIVSMAGALFPEPPTHRPIYKKVWGDPPDAAHFARTAPMALIGAWPADEPLPALWLHCGEGDTDRFLDWTLGADRLLTARAIPHTLELSQGGHHWGTWRPMGPKWIAWLGPRLAPTIGSRTGE